MVTITFSRHEIRADGHAEKGCVQKIAACAAVSSILQALVWKTPGATFKYGRCHIPLKRLTPEAKFVAYALRKVADSWPANVRIVGRL